MLDFVQQNPDAQALLHAYVRHFIVYKTGTASCSPQWIEVVRKWLIARLGDQACGACCLVGIHVLAKVHEMDFLSLSSWSISMNDFADEFLSDSTTGLAADMIDTRSLFSRILGYFERRLLSDSISRGEWSESFLLFLQHGCSMLAGDELSDPQVINRLRVLCFLHCLITASTSTEVEQRALHCLYDKESLRVLTDLSNNSLVLICML